MTPIGQKTCLNPNCNHKWYPRTEEEPALCPKCHSPYHGHPEHWKKKKNKLAEINISSSKSQKENP